ncbi:hypothetical protein GOP47_0019129 [Adiantum capillus-veneris]|uniref:C2H2-type domain-containing protein n=1 Tax=Adiantum capillus-veneris TaxID=13818 RepID=A0A9D4ZAC4_ADICA|nr:hypothetical protein GOP47_0019129 [Adiantum capillus-veneris]
MKRGRSCSDLHFPLPLPLPPLGLIEENDGAAPDRHSHAVALPHGYSDRKPGGDGADPSGLGFNNPLSAAKPAPYMQRSSRVDVLSSSSPPAPGATSQPAKMTTSAGSQVRPAQASAAGGVSPSDEIVGGAWPCTRSYGCNFCGREFSSAQALGGHMNIHRRDRARLRTSLENLQPSPTFDHHNYQTAVFACAPQSQLTSPFADNFAEYPIIMTRTSPDHMQLMNTPRNLAPPARGSHSFCEDLQSRLCHPAYCTSQSCFQRPKILCQLAAAGAHGPAGSFEPAYPETAPISDLEWRTTTPASGEALIMKSPNYLSVSSDNLTQISGTTTANSSGASSVAQLAAVLIPCQGSEPWLTEGERWQSSSLSAVSSALPSMSANLNSLQNNIAASANTLIRAQPGQSYSSGRLDLELRLGQNPSPATGSH